MTDNKEVKKVEGNMDSDKEIHKKDSEQVGTTTPVVSTLIVTITLEDTPKKGETIPPKGIQEFHFHKINGYNPKPIVDDSEGGEGNIHKFSQSQDGELDKEEVKPQGKDKTSSVVLIVLDNSSLDLNEINNLDKLEAEEDKKPWKLEDEMIEEDKRY